MNFLSLSHNLAAIRIEHVICLFPLVGLQIEITKSLSYMFTLFCKYTNGEALNKKIGRHARALDFRKGDLQLEIVSLIRILGGMFSRVNSGKLDFNTRKQAMWNSYYR